MRGKERKEGRKEERDAIETYLCGVVERVDESGQTIQHCKWGKR